MSTDQIVRLIRFRGAELRRSDCLWSSLIRLRQLPGFDSCRWLFDPETGRGMVLTIWDSKEAEEANRLESQAVIGIALERLGLEPDGTRIFSIPARALRADWAAGQVDRAEGAGARLGPELAELLDFVRDCEEFENFQDRVRRW